MCVGVCMHKVCVCGDVGVGVYNYTVVLYKNNTLHTNFISLVSLTNKVIQVISNHKLQVIPHTSVIPEKWHSFGVFFDSNSYQIHTHISYCQLMHSASV